MKKSEREHLIEMLVMGAFVSCADPRKPGVVVKRLSSEMREKIKQLTSDDFGDVRYG